MKTMFRLFLTGILFASASAYAQVRTDISIREPNNSQYGLGEQGYNGRNFSLGFGLGSSKMYGDLHYSNPQPVYIGYFEKNVMPTISLGWTVSVGDLSTRDPFTAYRSFNHFTSVDQHITIELATLFGLAYRDFNDLYLLRLLGGFYVGGGIGIINNDIKRNAYMPQDIGPGSILTTSPTMLNSSTALYVPMNVGYNLYFPKLWIFKGFMLNFNYQYSMGLSDYIDGYRPPLNANKKNDIFSVASVGMRFYVFHAAEY